MTHGLRMGVEYNSRGRMTGLWLVTRDGDFLAYGFDDSPAPKGPPEPPRERCFVELEKVIRKRRVEEIKV